MKRAAFVALILFLAVPGSLCAQYGVILHAAATEQRLGVGDAIRLVGAAAGSLRPELAAAEARSTLARLGVRLPRAAEGDPITWGGYAWLLVQLFDVHGDAAYGLFPGPLTAFGVLRSLGLVPPNARSGDPVDGGDALLALRRLVQLQGPTR
jgi:hypothetical protein